MGNKTLSDIRVLVVDDIFANRILLSATLDELGVKHDMANNGKIALDKIQATSYDIILLDIEMPIMNGYEVVKYIRENTEEPTKSMLVVGITAHELHYSSKKYVALGFSDMLAKPFSIERLLGIIKKYINVNKA